MFVNLSNHPSAMWSAAQTNASQKYGTIVDIPFPAVPADCDEKDLTGIGDELISKIGSLKPEAVMCQGEFTLNYYLVKKLISKNIKVLAACSERRVTEVIESNGISKKTVEFEFVRFREYR